jgi:type IV secretory pathway TrbL component
MHSLKNILVIASELNSNIFTGIKTFILRILPITIIVSLALFISLYVFSNFDIFEDVIQKIIFIGLASVTLPHILLHYFLDT